MEYVNSKKLEAVATFIGETEVEGNCICDNFNEVLEENKRIKSCAGTGCSKCLFNVTGESCTSAMTRWLLSEYKEPTPIKDVLKNCEVVNDAEE